MNSQNQTSKFHTHHFPTGTIVVLDDEMYSYTTSKIPGEEFEISKVVRTGPSNYVLETTKKMDREAFGDMNQAFNMTCVKAIVKRGSGPVVFHERDFDPTDFRFLEEKHILANYLNIKIKKTHFAHWSLRDILMFCINNRPVNGSMLDMEAMVEAVAKQSFVKTNDRDGRGFGCVSVVKKRLKRFIKQNYNRFLVSVEKTQKEQDKMYDEINERDFDAAFDEREPLDQSKLFPNRQEGSSYDRGSDYSPFDYDGFSFEEELDDLPLKDEELLTGQPVLDKAMEGGIPAGEPWPYAFPRVTMAEISVKHLETEQVKKHEEDM